MILAMKWVGVTGSWRAINSTVKRDLRREVSKVLKEGRGIVTGGALNVDYQATALALESFPDGSRIKVILPTSLKTYARHYRKRADEGIITHKQAEDLVAQLRKVDKLGSLQTMKHKAVDLETYFHRNSQVVESSDQLLAFQVNGSAVVQDTVDKAKKAKVPVKLFKYRVKSIR